MKNALGYAILTWCAIIFIPLMFSWMYYAEGVINDKKEVINLSKKTSIAISIFALIPTFAMFLLAL